MRKIIFAMCITFLFFSSAFGNATDDLFEAVQDENATVEKIQKIIKRGADVNAVKNFVFLNGEWDGEKEEEKRTALIIAATNVNPEVVKVLIKAGANVNYKNDNGNTALMKAIFSSGELSTDVIRALIAAGADVNARDNDGWTPLMLAIHVDDDRKNLAKKLKILIEAGANFNAKDKYGITPLMVAASSSGFEEFLINAGIKAGANINEKDKDGWTPLMWAAAFNDIEAVKVLLKAGANINIKDKYGMTALFWAIAVSPIEERPDYNLVKILIASGADVKIKKDDGSNAFLSAILKKDFSEITTTLGRDIDAKIAAKIETMINHFWGLGAGDDINTFYNDKFEIIKNLQNAGVDLNAKNKKGRTALMEASIISDIDSVKALIDAGADVSIKNSNGKTAYDLAKTYKVKKILLSSNDTKE